MTTRWIMILSNLCFTQQRSTSTSLPTSLGLHLFSKGVKSKEIDLLSRLGVTVSYKTVHPILEKVAEQEAVEVARQGSAEDSIMAYDNFEQMEGVKAQRIDDNIAFHSVTTGLVLRGSDIPRGGLTQNMLNRSSPLKIEQVLLAPGLRMDDLELRISRFFAAEAINNVFPEFFTSSHQGSITEPPMPRLDILPPRKTMYHPLGPILYNESSNAGNLAVLQNIFQNQYRMPG